MITNQTEATASVIGGFTAYANTGLTTGAGTDGSGTGSSTSSSSSVNTDNFMGVAGVSKSLGDHRRADKLRELAKAQCRAFSASTSVNRLIKYWKERAELAGIQTRRDRLEEALAYLNEVLSTRQRQLQAQVVTLGDLTVLQEARDNVQLQLIELRARQDTLPALPPKGTTNLRTLVGDVIAAQSQVVQLQAESGSKDWDVGLSAGVKKDYYDSAARPFVGINFSYTFGDRKAAASRASSAAADFAKSQYDGAVNSAQRALIEITAARDATTGKIKVLEDKKKRSVDTFKRLLGVDTQEARRLETSARLEVKLIDAELHGSYEELKFLNDFIQENQL
jgi:Arc/MetJ family transcription regulator